MALIDKDKLLAWIDMNTVPSPRGSMIYVDDLLQGLGSPTAVTIQDVSGSSGTRNVDTDSDLSLAAVGLWHKLRVLGSVVDKVEVLLLEQSPTAWGPGDARDMALQDIAAALDELLADGYVEELDDDRLELYFEVDLGADE